MTPTRHPTPAVLADYASGAMRPAFGAVVAAHLERCPECRKALTMLETLGGALIEDLPPTPVDEARLAAVMDALDSVAAEAEPEAATTLERIEFGREQPLAPGMSVTKARGARGGDLLYKLRLPAGTKTLPHGHRGVEFTTVLTGAYNDAGVRYGPGDFCELDSGMDHQPEVTPDAECICLIASEMPMRMSTGLGRLIQALIRV